jgi:hypothetical protein
VFDRLRQEQAQGKVSHGAIQTCIGAFHVLAEKEVEEDEEDMNLEAFSVPLREWIAQDRTRREIKRYAL